MRPPIAALIGAAIRNPGEKGRLHRRSSASARWTGLQASSDIRMLAATHFLYVRFPAALRQAAQ